MTKEQLQKASEASNRVSAYETIEKILRASGIVSLLNNEIKQQISNDPDILQGLTNDLIPVVSAKLEQAKQDFDKL